MELHHTDSHSGNVSTERMAKLAAAFRAGVHLYGVMGSPLYAALCAAAAEDPETLTLSNSGLENMRPIHIFAAVHYLLLQDRDDPLSQYFATFTENPLPPDQAFPDFARYCRAHRDEIRHILETSTIQTTYVERCGALLVPMSVVAEQAGEPLNLVEIGCSAGVLLTFDKYAYQLEGRGRIGPADAPLTLTPDVRGGPPLHIPRIGRRIGLDLHSVDTRSEEGRRWLLALCFPEYREQQARLAKALDVVAGTDIQTLEGDALELLPGVLAETPDPLCVYHSSCLSYWSPQAKAALDGLLQDASYDRVIYRIGIEPSEKFSTWQNGQADTPDQPKRLASASGEVTISRYQGGTLNRRVVAHTTSDYGTIEWIE